MIHLSIPMKSKTQRFARLHQIAKESKWPQLLVLRHEYDIALFEYLKGLLDGDPIVKNSVLNWAEKHAPAARFVVRRRKNGKAILVNDLGVLSMIAREAFERGILYVRDAILASETGGDVFLSLKPPEYRRTTKMLRERVGKFFIALDVSRKSEVGRWTIEVTHFLQSKFPRSHIDPTELYALPSSLKEKGRGFLRKRLGNQITKDSIIKEVFRRPKPSARRTHNPSDYGGGAQVPSQSAGGEDVD